MQCTVEGCITEHLAWRFLMLQLSGLLVRAFSICRDGLGCLLIAMSSKQPTSPRMISVLQ